MLLGLLRGAEAVQSDQVQTWIAEEQLTWADFHIGETLMQVMIVR